MAAPQTLPAAAAMRPTRSFQSLGAMPSTLSPTAGSVRPLPSDRVSSTMTPMSQSYDFRGSIGSPFGAPYPSTPLSQRYPDEVSPLSQRRIDEPFATQPKEEPEEIEE